MSGLFSQYFVCQNMTKTSQEVLAILSEEPKILEKMCLFMRRWGSSMTT